MKSLYKIFFLLGVSLLLQTETKAQTKDASAKDITSIKAVIASETNSFFGVDFKNWSGNWLKTPYVYWSYSDSTGTSFVEGWDSMVKTFNDYFKTSKPSKAIITQEWIEVRVYGNGAYVRFIQKVKDEIDRDETSQVRVLEKKDGAWKVVFVGAIAKYPPKEKDKD